MSKDLLRPKVKKFAWPTGHKICLVQRSKHLPGAKVIKFSGSKVMSIITY